LTLLETALVLSLSGVVLAVFIPTFMRRVRTNKIHEAAELLSEMSRRASAYYERHERDCLPAGAGPTPESPTVESHEVDFWSPETPGHGIWRALEVRPERPIRYSYEYAPSASGCGLSKSETPVSIVFRARGDLDGDGVLSTFERHATVGPGGFTPSDVLLVHQRTE
jgi:type II secretory pathway pseudopilin PulG